MRKLITVLAALVSGMALVAETRADVNFEARLTQVFRVSGSFDVDVEIRSTGTETFVLGTSTFLFNYNIAGLTTPAKVSANDGPWDLNVVTEGDYLNVALNSGTGWAGLRVEFAGGDPDPVLHRLTIMDKLCQPLLLELVQCDSRYWMRARILTLLGRISQQTLRFFGLQTRVIPPNHLRKPTLLFLGHS